MTQDTERDRIGQSNEVASIVIAQGEQHRPDVFIDLDLRYGIADALWNAGYRKVVAFGVDWTCEAHGDTCPKQGSDWDCDAERNAAQLAMVDRDLLRYGVSE